MSVNVKKTLLKARGLAKKGSLAEAAELYNKVLEAYPKNREAAQALASLGQPRAAPSGSVYISAPRNQVEPLLHLMQNGRLEEALEHGKVLVQHYRKDPLVRNLVGTVCVGLGQYERAVALLKESVQLKPDYGEAFSNLGTALTRLGRHEEAVSSLKKAVKYSPGDADAHYNLGNALREAGQALDAIESFRHALQLAPGFFMAHYNLASALLYTGDLENALASYDKAIEVSPENTDALSNRLYCMSEMASVDGEFQREQAEEYGRLVSTRTTRQYDQWNCDLESEKLSVAFVSADLCEHPVGYFLEGMLSHLDRKTFEVRAYSNTAAADETTVRLQRLFDHWQDIASLDDAAAAELIHSDAPHILIDLSGHTRGGRLGVFAYKPAPVQATWLGYWATTGVPQIDYKLGDSFVTPAGGEAWFTEDIISLPRSVLCFTPPAEEVPVGPLPATGGDGVTFGCFNRYRKLTDEVVATWAEILKGVPGSRLYLKADALGEAAVASRLTERFASHGIDAARLILEGPSSRAEYFEAYHRIDIALDPFPYPGGTTSAEALWMGVPVLTRRGSGSPLSAQGESLVHHSGLPDWIADDRDDYVARAIAFAADVPALSSLREGLRQRVLASDFFNAVQFATDFQDGLREMWDTYRENY